MAGLEFLILPGTVIAKAKMVSLLKNVTCILCVCVTIDVTSSNSNTLIYNNISYRYSTIHNTHISTQYGTMYCIKYNIVTVCRLQYNTRYKSTG